MHDEQAPHKNSHMQTEACSIYTYASIDTLFGSANDAGTKLVWHGSSGANQSKIVGH